MLHLAWPPTKSSWLRHWWCLLVGWQISPMVRIGCAQARRNIITAMTLYIPSLTILFFQGNPKWPSSKYHLTYGFLHGTPTEAMSPVAKAFETWAANTHFRFSRAQDHTNADIKVSFHRRDHGDGHAFDWAGGILAHAWAPTDGRFHYDADEQWSVGASPGAFDLETIALHEIGHLLGLDHSLVEGAIMWPSIRSGVTQGLHRDDIDGLKALYNF